MKKIIVFLFAVVLPCVCGAQQNANFTFVTVIASPWGVTDTVNANNSTDKSKVKKLDFLPVGVAKSGKIKVFNIYS